jgi:glycosyltransferase involved in cell wall biosynthesis
VSLVSAIIPVFNCERYVAAALSSVLRQTVLPDEIIVVDDGSTDATPKTLAQFGSQITVIRQTNCGGAAATNRGVEAATGRFLCFLDADDVWMPGKTARQLEWLAKYPDTEAVFGHVQQFIGEDLAPRPAQRLACPEAPQPGISKITMMIHRQAFDRIGLFDPALQSVDFLEWYTRAIERHLCADTIPDVVAMRRLHATNTGIRKRDSQRFENLDALKRSLDRRRAARNHQ